MDFLNNGCEPTELKEISLFLLMYADDTVLFSRSVTGLQSMLDTLALYTEKWSLTVNVAKTKIMVFRNGGIVKPQEHWVYKGEDIEIVDEFCYLGIVFYYNGKFHRTQKQLSLQCRKAVFALKRKCSQMSFNHHTLLSLFDTYISSISYYGCEVWGAHAAQDLEKVHLDFCKNILGVKRSTPNAMIYAELGRVPMMCIRKLRMVKYWLKLLHSDNCILKSCIDYFQEELMLKPNCKNWLSNVQNILSEIGLNNIWFNQADFNEKFIVMEVKQRLTDIYKQLIISDLNASSKCSLYKYVVDSVTLQSYLSKPIYNEYKILISRLRLSSHCLNIETGKYNLKYPT